MADAIRPQRPLGAWLADNRIYLLLALVFLVMSLWAPHFLSAGVQGNILRGIAVNSLLAAGLTLVLIVRQMDLSFGSVLTLSAMVAAKLYPQAGWAGAVAGAAGCGLAIGLANGFLVAKAKVDSFIATLGSMIVVAGVSVYFSHGQTLTIRATDTIHRLETPLLGSGWLGIASSPMVLLTLGLVLVFELFLKRTSLGRAFFLVGGNPKTAWYSGLPLDRLTAAAFAVSGLLAGLAGALTLAYSNTAQPGAGAPSLMVVIAAVIVGGTSMDGGRGSAVKSWLALITLAMITAGYNLMGHGTEVIAIASGVVLGGVILYDAVTQLLRRRRAGARAELLAEPRPPAPEPVFPIPASGPTPLPEEEMQRKDSVPLSFCLASLGAVTLVALVAMVLISKRPAPVVVAGPANPGAATSGETPAAAGDSAEELARIYASVKPFLGGEEPASIPPRPADPAALPEDDAGHWYDKEYAGWNIQRATPIKSPGDGPKGKRITHLGFVDHPYFTAYKQGLRAVAAQNGVILKEVCADNDVAKQTQQVDQVLVEKPDLVIINTVNADAAAPLLRKMHAAGIPVIASNQLCSNEALKYSLAWCGPDDWGNFRALARAFAEKLGYEGGYCIMRHFPGNSCDDSRTWSVVTELKKIAPRMVCLDMQHCDLKADKAEQVTAGWITNHGAKLKGIVSADDSGAQLGINKACKDAKRTDIVRVAAGNSKVGMDAVRSGEVYGITFQPSEGDGALAMQLAVDWFEGKKIPEVRYLPHRVLTKDNIDQYPPARW